MVDLDTELSYKERDKREPNLFINGFDPFGNTKVMRNDVDLILGHCLNLFLPIFDLAVYAKTLMKEVELGRTAKMRSPVHTLKFSYVGNNGK